MIRLTSTVALLLLAGIQAVAQDSHWGADNDPRVKMIAEAERKWAASNCADQPILKEVIADDFQGTAPSGERFDKAAAIETDRQNLHRDCALDSLKVRFFGTNLAMAYGTEHSLVKDKEGKESGRCLVWTDTWLKRKGKWQIIAAQDTQVECK